MVDGYVDHWMEGDWPEGPEDTDDVKAMKRLVTVAKQVLERCTIADDKDDELIGEFDDAINDAELFLYPEDDATRSMGWVGDDGLP
jgi:hypothetical protein